MSKSGSGRVIRLAEAQRSIPGPAGELAVVVFRRGPLDVALSLPLRPSQQTPHLQDEIYFIVRGQGVLCHDGKRERFESGDLLFVAAGIEHQIEEISENANASIFRKPNCGIAIGDANHIPILSINPHSTQNPSISASMRRS